MRLLKQFMYFCGLVVVLAPIKQTPKAIPFANRTNNNDKQQRLIAYNAMYGNCGETWATTDENLSVRQIRKLMPCFTLLLVTAIKPQGYQQG